MSTKQRIKCFKEALPSFLEEQKQYIANRKVGIRPRKEVKNGNR